MRRSFALRLSASFAAVGIAGALLTALLVNLAFGARFHSYLQAQQQAREQQLEAALAGSYQRAGGWDPVDLAGVTSMTLMDGGSVRITDPSGGTVWTATPGSVGGHMSAAHRAMMGSGPLGPEQSFPIQVNGSVVGTAHVRMPQTGLMPTDTAFRSSVNRLLVAGGIVAAVAALGVGLLLARRAVAPARELTGVARALASGDRSDRLSVDRSDEFGEMAASFNLMADAIEREDKLRRDFGADVAHELRTPLAILQTQVEAMQDGVTEPTTDTLASLHEEVLRISRLVADLETVASADAAGFTLQRESVDLASLLERVLSEFTGPFDAQGVGLEGPDAGPEFVVWGDPARLHQVFANLLSNALKFTPSGGTVWVRLRPQGGWAAVEVSDTGRGIEPDDISRVFSRFFRGRGTTGSGGSGIGLTVVQQIVGAHGGEIRVSSDPGRGTTFIVRLPQASQAAPTTFTDSSNHPPTLSVRQGGAK